MKRFLLASSFALVLSAVSGLFVGSSTAMAEDGWMFKRSYYSHDPVTEVRIGRQFSTGPVFTRPQGQYVKSGFRYERSSIIIPQLNTYDNMNVYETWIQTGSKF